MLHVAPPRSSHHLPPNKHVRPYLRLLILLFSHAWVKYYGCVQWPPVAWTKESDGFAQWWLGYIRCFDIILSAWEVGERGAVRSRTKVERGPYQVY